MYSVGTNLNKILNITDMLRKYFTVNLITKRCKHIFELLAVWQQTYKISFLCPNFVFFLALYTTYHLKFSSYIVKDVSVYRQPEYGSDAHIIVEHSVLNDKQ